MEEGYVCTLTESSLAKAKQELNEVPSNRQAAVQALRDWIQQQKHIKCISSTQYLLPFLRTAKFSQLRARELIEGHLKLQTELAHWYQELDPLDPKQHEALKTGILLPLPGYDKEGRKVMIYREGAMTSEMNAKLKKDKTHKNNLFKSFLTIFKFLLFDENAQVNGFVFLNDFTGYTTAHFTKWTLDEIKDLLKWQGNFPGRHKGFYYYNTGTIFESVLEVIRPFMGKKMKDRMKVLGNNLENVYKVIPMEMLPVEYLPDDYVGPHAGSVQQLIDNIIKELQVPAIRERIVYETSPEWHMTKTQKEDGTAASFLKLNVN